MIGCNEVRMWLESVECFNAVIDLCLFGCKLSIVLVYLLLSPSRTL